MMRRRVYGILTVAFAIVGVFYSIPHTHERDAYAEVAPSATTSTLLFVGDIMLSRDVARQIELNNDAAFPFRKIAEITKAADVLVGNLENPVSWRGKNEGSVYSFRAHPSVIAGLSYAGFDVLTLANNHIFDWGRDALSDTVAYLKSAGIATAGAGRDEREANEPAMVRSGGATIAILSYTDLYPENRWAKNDVPGIARADISFIGKKIKEARSHADIVVVAMHWGEEYERVANAHQREWAHALIDAGADLVVGTHPHVIQELERYKNGWVAYSLGNFVFDQNFSDETRQGAMLEVDINNKKIVRTNLISIVINDEYQPEIENPPHYAGE